MIANFLIGLREGLEAALVVGILVAYLVQTGRRDRLGSIWAGVAIAAAASLTFGGVLTFTAQSLPSRAQEAFEGAMSVVAVAFVTGMIFWMRRQARRLSGELKQKVEAAASAGGAAMAVTAFVAVGREGLETSLFLWPAMRSAGGGPAPAAGALLGVVTAVAIGYGVYRRSISLNLAAFFKLTGAALIVIAAGVLAYGLHDLAEGGIVASTGQAFDVSAQVPPSSWYGSLLKGVFNFNPAPGWAEVVAYVAYALPTMALFLWRLPAPRPASAPPGRTESTRAGAR